MPEMTGPDGYVPEGQLADRPAQQQPVESPGGAQPPDDRRGEEKEVKKWQDRIRRARKVKDKWVEKFNVKNLESYYQGIQRDLESVESDDPVVNVVFSNIESIMPSVMYYNPKFNIRPQPARSDDQLSDLPDRCKLREDMLHCLYNDPKVFARDICDLALKESMFAFGVVEVGFTADFVDNPNANKPILDDKTETPILDSNQQPIVDTRQRLISDESLYLKRIGWEQWLVSSSNRNVLEHNDWCGYWEKINISDLRNDPYYDAFAVSMVKSTGHMEDASGDKPDTAEDLEDDFPVKIHVLYDLRANERIIIADGCNYFLKREPYKFLPLATLRHHSILDSWYPVPPVFNWIPVQKEINEARTKIRNQSRITNRMFAVVGDQLDPNEEDKLERGDDGAIVHVPSPTAVMPMQLGTPDRSVFLRYETAKTDFREVSGQGGEQRAVPEAETATQARIIDVNSRIRTSYRREMAARWLSRIGYLILQTAEKFMSLPMWIMRNVDPTSPAAMLEAARVAQNWQKITFADIGELSYDVSIDVEALSPMTQDQERQEWFHVLGLVSAPQVILFLLTSDELLRKTLGFLNIRADKDIQAIKQGLVMLMTMQMTMGGGATDKGVPSNPKSKDDSSVGGRADEPASQAK